jgi:asparagine synthase (glutamine-hydrolysing)
MCGIAGIAGEFATDYGAEHVLAMVAALARRGPDGEGVHAWKTAVFGHRRLAIFDLSDAGRQPMISPDGRIGVTFNGAIYNFLELRNELERQGARFVSRTDTEVLLHGYRAWGIDGLVERLHGMFAFALWDDDTRTLYLVRDRLGVKPLLFARTSDRIAFASTAAALHDGGFAGDLDPDAVVEFLEYGFITEARCIYAGVEKLPAGHVAQWRDGTLQLREYWRPKQAASRSKIGFEEAVAETERLLLRAVEMRLAADVRVGALLSGGVDSSLVCWAVAKLGGDITAFTVGTPGDPWDETADARTTARELGIRHRILETRAENAPGVDDLVAAFGEPFACASALGMIAVSQAVKREATVLLTGDGGDDVFLGYPRHAHLALAERIASTMPPTASGAWKTMRTRVPKVGMLRRAAHLLDYASGGLGAVANAHDGLPTYRRLGLLGERLEHASVEARRIPWSPQSGKRVLGEFLEYERATRFTGEYLTKVDGGTMYHALEARAPFLDQDIWTFASALPYSLRLRSGRLKAVLREIARRRISDRVAAGAKRGFGIPVQRWIAGRWRSDVEAAFNDSLLARAGWIRRDTVLARVQSLRDGETAPQQLWYLYVLENWLRRQAHRAAAPAYAR